VTQFKTIKETKAAVRKAKAVFIQARFGVSEKWLRVSKETAFDLLDSIDPNDTPKDMEMFAGSFGEMDIDRYLYLG